MKSITANVKAKSAGATKNAPSAAAPCRIALEKPAPIIGPNKKPTEKATPIKAYNTNHMLYEFPESNRMKDHILLCHNGVNNVWGSTLTVVHNFLTYLDQHNSLILRFSITCI